jgi:hypothetical protein
MSTEHEDFLQALAKHRELFLQTVAGITDEQAVSQTTVSELCLGGLIKHVAFVESGWVDFILDGPIAAMGTDEASYAAHANSFRLLDGETLAGVINQYEEVAARTAKVVESLPDLGVSQPLPEAPWFEPGARWSARRVLTHIVAETAQHAGHADIIREAIDGAKTMG